MDRGIPEFNRPVIQRQIQYSRALHYNKLRTISKQVDNDLPHTLSISMNRRQSKDY